MTEPLTHARIGYDSITTRGKVIASSARAGFPASAAANPLTYSYWSPILPAYWEVHLPEAEPCNYFGVAAHTLGSDRATVSMQAWIDSAWKTLPVFRAGEPEPIFGKYSMPSGPAVVNPFPAGLPAYADNRPLMVLVEEAVSNRFRLRFLGKGTPVVGVIYMGKALEMARPLYGGHTPLNLNRSTVIRPNLSERGQFLGRSIIRCGAHGSWTWNNLKAAWVRQKLDPFIEAARTRPFFILWRPATYPSEAGYCWTKGDQAPTNSGPADHMSFTLDAEGLGHE